jgi:hypothetical protein
MNAIRLIEKFIDERITEVLPILEKESVIYPKAELKYNASMGKLYSLVAFYLYAFLKQHINYGGTPECLAEKIAGDIKPVSFNLSAENGYLNVELDKSLIDSEIDRIACNQIDQIGPSNQNGPGKTSNIVQAPSPDDDFLLWYCCNKLIAGFNYLWDEKNTIKTTEDDETTRLALNVMYLDSLDKVSKDNVSDYAKAFYEYDKKLVGVTVPYNLYKASLDIFRKSLEK